MPLSPILGMQTHFLFFTPLLDYVMPKLHLLVNSLEKKLETLSKLTSTEFATSSTNLPLSHQVSKVRGKRLGS